MNSPQHAVTALAGKQMATAASATESTAAEHSHCSCQVQHGCTWLAGQHSTHSAGTHRDRGTVTRTAAPGAQHNNHELLAQPS